MAQASISSSSYLVNIGYDGTDGVASNFLMPPLLSKAGEPIVVIAGLLYLGGSDWSTNPQYKFSNGDFSFALVAEPGQTPPAQGSPGQYQTTVSVQVTIAANNVWKGSQDARAALMTNWVDLRERVDALEVAGALIRGGARIVTETVAAFIPAPPMETLFYRFGLQSGLAAGQIACCDLIPGMQLRVEFEQSQFLGPGANMNGYVGGSQLRWQIASTPKGNSWTSAFDPFLGAIATPTVQSSTPAVAAGLLDLQRAGSSRRHLRLCYPQTIPSGDATGNLSMTNNIAILGADTLSDLKAATIAYANGSAPADPATSTILRGRAVAVPEIAVWVLDANQNNHIEWVPLGTTVSQMLERFMQWRPLSPLAAMPLWLRRNIVRRSGPTVMNESLSVVPLAFFPSSSSVPVDPASYDVPLMPGDRFGLLGAPAPAPGPGTGGSSSDSR